MRILLTNTAGIESRGLHVLARLLTHNGHDVIVVAPDRDYAGSSAALGRINATDFELHEMVLPGSPTVRAWRLSGPPGVGVLAAGLGAFGPCPDVVVAGINHGLSVGRSILHFATVGAALTAQNFGMSALAVSLQRPDDGTSWEWETAATLAGEVIDSQLRDAPARSLLNLNVPSRPLRAVAGVRWARVAPFGPVRVDSASAADGVLRFAMTPDSHRHDPDTDTALLVEGSATLTTLVGVTEAWPENQIGWPEDMDSWVFPGAEVDVGHAVPHAEQAILRRPDNVAVGA